MPLQGEFHRTYWENSDTHVAPTLAASGGGYPLWQSHHVTVMGSLFGGLQDWAERVWDGLTWAWRLFGHTRLYDQERRAVVLRAMTLVTHPAYPLARVAVRKTATTLGFNRPEAWKELSRELKGSAGQAENAFRHLEACRLVRANLLTSTVTNPELHAIVELAYQGFSRPGWDR